MTYNFTKAVVTSKDLEFFGDTDSIEEPMFIQPSQTDKPVSKLKFEMIAQKPNVRRNIPFFRNKDVVSSEMVTNSVLEA